MKRTLLRRLVIQPLLGAAFGAVFGYCFLGYHAVGLGAELGFVSTLLLWKQ